MQSGLSVHSILPPYHQLSFAHPNVKLTWSTLRPPPENAKWSHCPWHLNPPPQENLQLFQYEDFWTHRIIPVP